MQDKTLFYLVATLIATSIILSYSLGVYAVLHFGYDHFHFFERQLISGTIAILVLWFIATKLSLQKSYTFGLWLFIFSFILMISMSFLPSSLVTSVGGAKRWIRLPGFSISPVELFKVGFVFFLAWSFNRKFQHFQKERLGREIISTLPYIALFLIAVFSIAIFQNDIGQVVVLGLTLGFMLLFSGRSFKLFMVLMAIAISLFILFISISEHRIKRIKMWWAGMQELILSYLPGSLAQKVPLSTAEESYQVINSLHAIHNGGLEGQGLGNGTIKLGFLSDVHTDFVLSGLTEELGYIGLVAITVLYALILHRILRIANRAHDRVTYLYGIGVASLIGFSLLINSYGIVSLIPIKGLPVPFLSYGGSSMIANAIAIGLLLALAKKS
jgi:cell division protein FtsW